MFAWNWLFSSFHFYLSLPWWHQEITGICRTLMAICSIRIWQHLCCKGLIWQNIGKENAQTLINWFWLLYGQERPRFNSLGIRKHIINVYCTKNRVKPVKVMHACMDAFIHAVTHSVEQSFIPSFLHSFMHSDIQAFMHSFIHSFTPSPLRPLTLSFFHAFLVSLLLSHPPSFFPSFVSSFLRSFVFSFFRSFVGSFVPPFVRSFVRSLVHIAARLRRMDMLWWSMTHELVPVDDTGDRGHGINNMQANGHNYGFQFQLVLTNWYPKFCQKLHGQLKVHIWLRPSAPTNGIRNCGKVSFGAIGPGITQL